MKTIKQFIEQSNIPSKLVRSVIRRIGGWDEFKERAQDVTNHGADGGFCGFTYYTDTVSFAKHNKPAIEGLLKDLADSIGEDFAKILTSFNCLQGYEDFEILEGYYNPRSEMRTQVYNALAWFALEEVCRNYCDWIE